MKVVRKKNFVSGPVQNAQQNAQVPGSKIETLMEMMKDMSGRVTKVEARGNIAPGGFVYGWISQISTEIVVLCV